MPFEIAGKQKAKKVFGVYVCNCLGWVQKDLDSGKAVASWPVGPKGEYPSNNNFVT